MNAVARRWQAVPMRDWPTEAFEQLGLRNPYEPGNLTIRRQALFATRNLGGTIVECGTFRGQGLASLAWLMREVGDTRAVFGFDSFRGFPHATSCDMIHGTLPSSSNSEYFAGTSENEVRDFFETLSLHDRIMLIPGFFCNTLPKAPVKAISLLILDCDLYESYRTCLKYLYPKVQEDGWIIFDEYFSPKYPGACIAVDEFFTDKPEKPRLAKHLLAEHPYERWYIVKTR